MPRKKHVAGASQYGLDEECVRQVSETRAHVGSVVWYVRPMTRNCAKVLPAIVAVVKLEDGFAELCARFWSVREVVRWLWEGSCRLIVCGS